jgi:hypothetical protein
MSTVRHPRHVFEISLAIGLLACQPNPGISVTSQSPTATRSDTSTAIDEKDASAKDESIGSRPDPADKPADLLDDGNSADDAEAAKAKDQREIRSRKIAALKERIGARRDLLQLKESQRVSLVSARTTVDGKSIESYNKPDESGSIITGLSQIGSDNAIGGTLATGFGVWEMITNAMDEAEQKGEVLSAREAVERQIKILEEEIAGLGDEIAKLESDLDALIDPV